MEFSNQLEIEVARKIYSRFPRLDDVIPGSPAWIPATEVHMGKHNEFFTNDPEGWPLFQGSMVTHFDYRAKGYVSGHGRNVAWVPLPFGSPDKLVRPQWRYLPENIPNKVRDRVRRTRIGFCDIARADDQRSLMAALIPPETVCGHKVPTIEFDPLSDGLMLLWLAVANSLTMDFLVRMKVALTMSLSLLGSLPFPRVLNPGTEEAYIASLAARLSCGGSEMAAFREKLSSDPAFVGLDISICEDADQRAVLAAEINVRVARNLFGLSRDEMRYLLDPRDVLGAECPAETFAALIRAEQRELGEYRTQRLVLETWGRMDAGQLA